jgi:hypothetical protein
MGAHPSTCRAGKVGSAHPVEHETLGIPQAPEPVIVMSNIRVTVSPVSAMRTLRGGQ